MLITLLSFIVVIGVLIFVHELGHFMTAKLVDIEVPRFSIGLGPKLWGFRHGETEYVISWLPLGGYVKMAGMEELEAIEGGADAKPKHAGITPSIDVGLTQEVPTHHAGSRDFESKSLPARALVISAGVIMNVLFALLVFSLSALVWGATGTIEPRVARVDTARLPAGTEALGGIPNNARILAVDDESIGDWQDLERTIVTHPAGPLTIRAEGVSPIRVEVPKNDSLKAEMLTALAPALPPIIGQVEPGLPADRAGLQEGDRVLEAGGRPVVSWIDLVTAVESHGGKPVELVVARGAERVRLVVEPEMMTIVEGEPAAPRIGVGVKTPRERFGLGQAVVHGAGQTWYWISTTAGFLGQLFTGKQSARNLGGPILIGQVSGKVARAGLEAFLNFMAIFSINLAVLNLLPIPVLDGGQLLFLGVEAVRGRALSIEQRMRLSQIGFVIVIAIMVWALANDVLRLFGV